MTSRGNDRGTGSTLSDADIIERFGGIRPMAAKLGVAVTTVQGWKNRGHIPENRHDEIRAAAARHGIDLGEAGAAAAAAGSGPGTRGPAEPQPESGPEPASAAEFPHRSRAAATATGPAADQQPAAAPAAPPPAGRAALLGPAWAALALAALVAAALFTRPLWEPSLYPDAGAGAGAADGGGDAEALRELEAATSSQYQDLRQRLTALEAGGGVEGEAFARQLGALEDSLSGLDSTMASLNEAVAGLDRRIAALEAARDEVPQEVRDALRGMAADTAALRADIAALGERLDAREKTVTEGLASLREETSALDGRVAELEARPVQTGEKIAALALAVGQVEAALDTGRPYRGALDRLAAIAEEDMVVHNGVYRLAQWADTGIPPASALQRRFAEIAPTVERALSDPGGDSWLERTWHSISTVVTVRRIDGEGDISPVSKAEAALADGDLSAAVAALDAAGPLGEAGSEWLEQARARVFAESELESLYGRVIAPMVGGGEDGAAGDGGNGGNGEAGGNGAR